jgi:DNA-binding transcriptional ArsR family regulator
MLDDVLKALSEPHRRRILALLRSGPHNAGDIAAVIGDISRPAVSQHLRVLRDAELVRVSSQGTERIYRIDQEGLAEARTYIDAFWEASLGRLKTSAEAEAKRRRHDG